MANILTGAIGFEVTGLPQLDKAGKSVDVLNNRLKATKNAGFAFNQILREAPAFAFSFQTGLVGISNNLPIFTDAIQRARESGAGFGTIIKSLAGSLFSLPSILSIGVLALTQFGGSSAKAKTDTEQLNKATEEANKKQQEFKNALDKASGAVLSQAANIDNLRNVLVSTNSEFDVLNQNVVNQAVTQFLFDKKNVEVQKILNAEIQKRLNLSQQLLGVSALPEFTTKGDTKNPLTKQIYEAEQQLGILNRTAKSLGLTFDNILKPTKVNKVTVKPERIEIDPQLSKYDILEVSDKDFTVDTSKIKLFSSTFLNDFKTQNEALLKPIREQLLKLRDLGVFVGNAIADGFTNAFSAIAKGESPIKALGEALKALVLDLIQAAIRAFVVKQIVNLFAPGLGGIANGGALSGLFEGFRAGGGPVTGGRGYIVGENGPEWFQPGTNGSIIPNGRLSTMSGGGFAGRVVFEISGNKLIGVLANGNRSQGALI